MRKIASPLLFAQSQLYVKDNELFRNFRNYPENLREISVRILTCNGTFRFLAPVKSGIM